MIDAQNIMIATSVARRGGPIGLLPVEGATRAPEIADCDRDCLDLKLRQL